MTLAALVILATRGPPESNCDFPQFLWARSSAASLTRWEKCGIEKWLGGFKGESPQRSRMKSNERVQFGLLPSGPVPPVGATLLGLLQRRARKVEFVGLFGSQRGAAH